MKVTLFHNLPKAEQFYNQSTGELVNTRNTLVEEYQGKVEDAISLRVISEPNENEAAMEIVKKFSEKYPQFTNIKSGKFEDGSFYATASKGKRDNAVAAIAKLGL